jgi:hypothetical protein
MRDECMAPNGKQRALMFQMNVVDRQIDQKVRLLLRLEKFVVERDRAPERDYGSKQDGVAPKRAMNTKKDIAPFSCKPL